MARNTVILGQEKMSYSKAIRKITGWSQKKFETEKRLMRYRVANFNQLTGSKLSPIEELYYRVRFEDRQNYYKSKGKPVLDYNPLQQFFKNIKTGKADELRLIKVTRQDGLVEYMTAQEYAKDYIIKRYEGLANNFTRAKEIIEELKAGLITTQDANKKLKDFAEEMRELKSNPATALKWIEEHYDFVGSE